METAHSSWTSPPESSQAQGLESNVVIEGFSLSTINMVYATETVKSQRAFRWDGNHQIALGDLLRNN